MLTKAYITVDACLYDGVHIFTYLLRKIKLDCCTTWHDSIEYCIVL